MFEFSRQTKFRHVLFLSDAPYDVWVIWALNKERLINSAFYDLATDTLYFI